MRRFQGVAASLFACACAAGCGKTTSLVDAGGDDANTTDANTAIDATPVGDVTVTTYSRYGDGPFKGLKSDIPVATIQPDGSAGPTGTTGADGKVTLSGVLSGASVTAVYTTSYGYQLVTTVGVKPGDNLVYGDQYASPQVAQTGSVSLTFPTVTGATNYVAYASCSVQASSGTSPITLPIACTDAKTNVGFIAYDDGGTPIASGMLHDVALTDATTAALTAWTAAPAPNNFTSSISGVSATINNANFFASWDVTGAISYGASSSQTPSSGAASGMMTVLQGGDRIYSTATLYNQDSHIGALELYRVEPGTSATSTFTAPTIPGLSNPIVSSGAQAASWLTVGKGPYDGTVAFLYWTRPDGGESQTEYDWTIIIPPGVNQLDWSATPPAGALADAWPTLQDQVLNDGMQLVDLSTTNGYDELRQAPEWQITCPGCSTESGEIPGGSQLADGGEGPFTGRSITMQRRLIRHTTHAAIRAAK